jgi:hypothetical protein
MTARFRDAAGPPWLWMLVVTAFLLPACTAPAPSGAGKAEYMFWPAAPDSPHIQFLTSISSTADVTQRQDTLSNFLYGEDTTGDLPFERPYGIRMYDGKLFVCDATAATVAILDFRNQEVRLLGQTGQVHLSKPIDIAVAPDGVKYVTDTGHGAVLVYDASDHYAGRISVTDLRPVGAAVRGNELYVTDLKASKVRVFNRFNGQELRSIGEKGAGNGQFGGVFGLALDSQGDIYVNDIITCRLQKLAPGGAFLWGVGGLGDHPGQFVRPKLMTVDSENYVYVVDYAFTNVQVFDENGNLLTFFGGLGGFPGAMDGPTGVCVSDANLDLFAQYVHPAFQARRLVFVTNNIGSRKINVYALGELKPGKSVADISAGRVQGIFGVAETAPADTLQLELGTQPATGSGTQPGTQPASAPRVATPPATPSETRPKEDTPQPF